MESIKPSSKTYRDKTCDFCGVKFTPVNGRQRFCTSCGADSLSERRRTSDTKRRAGRKTRVFAHYGTTCACCGATENLSIDHVGGNGKEHRQEIGLGQWGGTAFYQWLITNDFPPGFQTLCSPCNNSKGVGEHCLIHDPACPTCHRPLEGATKTRPPNRRRPWVGSAA